MQTLTALTNQLMADLGRISHREAAGHVVYELEQGQAISFTLKRDRYVHVVDTYLAPGTIFPLHHHKASHETMILQRGEVTLVCDEQGCQQERIELRPGVPVYIPTIMNHFVHAKEGSWLTSVFVPPDPQIK